MKIKFLKFAIIISSLILILTGCTTGKYSKKDKSFKHDTPLIKTDVKKLGKIELEKRQKMRHSPVDGDIIKLNKPLIISFNFIFDDPITLLGKSIGISDILYFLCSSKKALCQKKL